MMAALLEVIVTSVEDAVAAARGGAHRLEVVSQLEEDGLTPEMEIVERITQQVSLPLRVMVRPRDQFSHFTPAEKESMAETVQALAVLGVDGVVVGFLTPDSEIDFDTRDHVLEHASGLGVTFHRAFDHTRHMLRAVGHLVQHDLVDRLLTSGGAYTAIDGITALADLNRLASSRLTLIAAGGITEQSLPEIAGNTGVREFHVGRSVRVPATAAGRVDARKVAALVEALSVPASSPHQ